MAETKPQSHDMDEVIRLRVLERAASINKILLDQFTIIGKDLSIGSSASALGGLDGLESLIQTMRVLVRFAL